MTASDGTTGERRLGDFVLLEEIGRGGMGVVYRAEQGATGRAVALKVLPALNGFDDAAVARFRREADAARRLLHPGIVPIRAVGEAEGVHFFAMDLVDGPSLEQVLLALRARRPEDLGGTLFDESGLAAASPELAAAQPGRSCVGWRYAASCANVAAEIADALAAAHAAGVTHRDVKPSNVLLNPEGRPILVDFGLAHDERAAGLTRSGDKLGTPTYMAPEQARGQRDTDGRVDVYGLGVTLYELLTLRPPFEADSEAELLRRIVEEDVRPVRQLNPRVPAPLARIVECCLAKDPADRYASIVAVAEDLRACLDGRPVVARRPALHRRLRRVVARHKRRAFVAGLVVSAAGVAAMSMGLATHHEAHREAMLALEHARSSLEDGRTDRADAAYGRAAAALTTQRVEDARRRHALSMFETRYAERRFDELARLFRDWPARPRSEFWDALLERAEGRGSIDVRTAGVAAERVEIGRFDGDGLFSWEPWREDRQLTLGPHLVAVESDGAARIVQLVQVERDQAVGLTAPAIPLADTPSGFAVVPLDAGVDRVLVARSEMSAGEYARVLRGIEDVALRAELLPDGWRDPVARPDIAFPVRGLSFAQARTFAALCGAHLPSLDERRAAANGGLAELTWPWGRTFSWMRVAAAPDGLGEPLPIDSRPGGASPCGVLDLIGNVREFTIDGDDVRAVGGHFASVDPAELRVDVGPELALDEVDGFTGLRLARFLPPEDDADLSERAARLVSQTPGALHDWSISAQGEIALTVERGPAVRPSQMAPDGMLQGTAPERAWPTAAVVHRAAHHDVELPSGGAAIHRLRLPRGARVDHCSPSPTVSLHERGQPVLLWVTPTEPASGLRVRFRFDGALTDEWPSRAPAFEVANRFLDALGSPERAALVTVLASEDFVWRPHGLGIRELAGPGRFGRFAERRFVDVTAVGPIVSVFLEVDRAVDAGAGAEEWVRAVPLVVQFDRRDGRVVALALDGREDGGTLVDGRYSHAPLGVELVAPPGVRLSRGRGAPLDLQLTCTAADAPAGVTVEVVGTAARPNETELAAMHRLTGGVTVARTARLLQDPVFEPFGPRERLRRATVTEWRIGHAADPSVARERWYLLARDRRWFLLRLSAVGKNREEADRRFMDPRSRRLLDAVATSIVLP